MQERRPHTKLGFKVVVNVCLKVTDNRKKERYNIVMTWHNSVGRRSITDLHGAVFELTLAVIWM